MTSDEGYIPIVLGALSISVTVLGGMFLFLWAGITKLRDDVRLDIDTMNNSVESKAGEHRQNQQQLWSELRMIDQRSTDHRNRMAERLGQLPTREEMKAARDEMRQDLHAMEERIRGMIGGRHEHGD